MSASLYYEALSKIPKRFIDDETKACEFGDNAIMLANPKFAPMQYTQTHRRWMKIGIDKGDWKITMRTAFIKPTPINKNCYIIKEMP